MRTLVNVNIGPVAVLSEVLSEVTKQFIARVVKNTIKSNEELIASFEDFNKMEPKHDQAKRLIIN